MSEIQFNVWLGIILAVAAVAGFYALYVTYRSILGRYDESMALLEESAKESVRPKAMPWLCKDVDDLLRGWEAGTVLPSKRAALLMKKAEEVDPVGDQTFCAILPGEPDIPKLLMGVRVGSLKASELKVSGSTPTERHIGWAGVSGLDAYLYMQRRGESWDQVEDMMHAWLTANGGQVPKKLSVDDSRTGLH